MRIFVVGLIFGFLSIISTVSFASGIAVVPTVVQENEETVVSIGLRLEFGDIVKPSVVVAVRRTRTDTSNDVTGGLAELSVPLSPGSTFIPTFKAMGIFGDTSVQGMAGVGFDFSKNQWLLGLGVQGDFVDGGININADGTIAPYIGGSSYDGAPTRKIVATQIGK